MFWQQKHLIYHMIGSLKHFQLWWLSQKLSCLIELFIISYDKYIPLFYISMSAILSWKIKTENTGKCSYRCFVHCDVFYFWYRWICHIMITLQTIHTFPSKYCFPSKQFTLHFTLWCFHWDMVLMMKVNHWFVKHITNS